MRDLLYLQEILGLEGLILGKKLSDSILLLYLQYTRWLVVAVCLLQVAMNAEEFAWSVQQLSMSLIGFASGLALARQWVPMLFERYSCGPNGGNVPLGTVRGRLQIGSQKVADIVVLLLLLLNLLGRLLQKLMLLLRLLMHLVVVMVLLLAVLGRTRMEAAALAPHSVHRMSVPRFVQVLGPFFWYLALRF